jgi:glycerophosphoryl diester phosphodiesterase
MKIKAWATSDGKPTRVIAHRGASGTLPEHTMEGYRLAIEQGADLIEPDLAITRDEVLIARHDYGLARSTDVASRPEFAERKRRIFDGTDDWAVCDFTWAEIQTLRATQPFPGRSKEYDGKLAIPRLEEVIALARNEGRRRGRWIGVYPELKDPGEYAKAGLDMTRAFIDLMHAEKQHGEDAIVWTQCFEPEPLVRVREATGLRCYELFVAEKCAEPGFFAGLAKRDQKVLDGIAVDKTALSAEFMRHARELRFRVHAWTFRDDSLPKDVAAPQPEYERAFALGVDALFSDFPSTALAARKNFEPA